MPGVPELRPALARTPMCLDPSASARPPSALSEQHPFRRSQVSWRDIPWSASIVIGRQPSPSSKAWAMASSHGALGTSESPTM